MAKTFNRMFMAKTLNRMFMARTFKVHSINHYPWGIRWSGSEINTHPLWQWMSKILALSKLVKVAMLERIKHKTLGGIVSETHSRRT